MSHAASAASAFAAPGDFAIPTPPRARPLARPAEPAWREAMRWSLIGLTASLAAGEVALWLAGF
jgi:hypothetical protein